MNEKTLSRRSFLKGVAAAAFSTAFVGLAEKPKAAAAAYVPGTYTATANGINGPVTVTATFDENSIVEVLLDVSGETQGIGAAAGDALRERRS